MHKTPERKLLERVFANNKNLGLGLGELDQGELDLLKELSGNVAQTKENTK